MAASIDQVIARVGAARAVVESRRAVLVAISGIDASGKGYISGELARRLRELDYKVALINVDGWLRLPSERFSAAQPAKHFYDHAIRFEEMFSELVVPLRDRRSLDLEFDFAEETASAYRKEQRTFSDIDVILLEGIYLLKAAYRRHYDLSIWIECSFETGLGRAVARAQEGLPPAETIHAYATIYYPAQRLHFRVDQPMRAADLVIQNDRQTG